MKVTVEQMPESRVALDIAAEESEFTKALERAYRKISRDINVPGFRPGKAPRQIIERFYGREIFVEEANKELMDQLYRQALEQESIVPIGEPEVELTAEEPIAFRVIVPVYPSVDPGPYTDVRVDPVDAAVEDDEVEDLLDRLRKGQGTWVDVTEPRKPAAGDQVTVDLDVKENGEQFQEPATDTTFVLGESNLFEALEERIREMEVGETAEIDLAFDDDDESVSPNIRGKALHYTLTLKGIKERQLPDLDDELAKSLGEKIGTDATTLEELRAELRTGLNRDKTTEGRAEVVNQIVNRIAESASIDLPSVMIDEAIDNDVNALRARLSQGGRSLEDYLRTRNQTEAELREELREEATRRVRNSLILREIAEREGIDVGEEEISAEIDGLTASATNPDQARQIYSSDYFRNALRNDIFERRLTDRLIGLATENAGAVRNAWVQPESENAEQTTEATAEAAEATVEPVEAAEAEETTESATAEDVTTAMETATEPEAVAAETEAVTDADGQPPAGAVRVSDVSDCPSGYPIKGNASSMIYHTPESAVYERTQPEICFDTEESAVAAGYRAPKRGGNTAQAASDRPE